MAQRSGTRSPRSQRGGAGDGARPFGRRELVVMVTAQTGLRASARGIAPTWGELGNGRFGWVYEGIQ